MLIFLFSNICGGRSETVTLEVFSEAATAGVLLKKLLLKTLKNSQENICARGSF